MAVIGLDGVGVPLVRDLTARGLMPNLAALAARGTIAPMRSSIPTISSVSWTGFMTGKNPGKHGIYGFTDVKPGTLTMFFPNFGNVQGLIATGDTFLKNTVGAIMNSQSFNGNSVIFITWDESDFPFNDVSGCCDAVSGGGHVVMITISHSSHAPRTPSVAYNHYSMLATIEDAWQLGCLGFTCDTANVSPMSDLVP